MARQQFRFSRLEVVRFYVGYLVAKTVLIWFEVRRPRARMALVEGLYSYGKVMSVLEKLAYCVPVDIVVSRYGAFEVRAGTIDVICASPEFERRDMRRLLKIISAELMQNKRVLFLDVGADLGTYSIAVANRFKNDNRLDIVAFEPAPTSYELLRRNLDRNGLGDRVDARQELLSDRSNQEIDFFYDARAPGGSGTNRNNVQKGLKPIKLLSTTLDQAVGGTVASYDVVIVKADVEGAETEILQGSESLFTAPKVYFLVEDFIDNRIITLLSPRARFLAKLTPYNSWWISERQREAVPV